ncbi:ADP-glyceromanno-heptose 6-epimerase [Gynurincola endophyticus]|jgi:ADP-L-glycero-D-manno-heptose 6-epimerase|uniref:ADP-glyceromanno-heptose 6-epimerase n=1 Tax=Gynurincola endophyticus TaxID=2479004 RepID=UPI000F8C98B7|nr:ADP-glyceromanno-heptose 6-epimerase [Gynurincola endophyticus]
MDKNSNIVVTGAAGFIGSALVQYLNEKGFENIIIVDDFSREDKQANWVNKQYIDLIERDGFFEWLSETSTKIDFIFHIGARTDTTEFDYSIHEKLNVEYTQKIWHYCTDKQIPLVYASSAATYGDGELGYKDDHTIVNDLKPLNPYGVSKNEFDKWALQQTKTPPFWAGLKFFNVYGPNEYHKARMASVIFHAFHQIKKTGMMKLFRSHRPDFKDGQQLRDFVYVKDVIKVCYWLFETAGQPTGKWQNGLYNLGTGQARSFEDLVKNTFTALDLAANIEFIDMPEDIRDKYQYFTEADMNKLKNAGYSDKFYSLEEGVSDYVRNYLSQERFY